MLYTIDELEKSNFPKYTFPENNNIKYSQDFCRWKNIPSGITWYKTISLRDGTFVLVTDGHGTRNHYGNGSIFVYEDYIKDYKL